MLSWKSSNSAFFSFFQMQLKLNELNSVFYLLEFHWFLLNRTRCALELIEFVTNHFRTYETEIQKKIWKKLSKSISNLTLFIFNYVITLNLLFVCKFNENMHEKIRLQLANLTKTKKIVANKIIFEEKQQPIYKCLFCEKQIKDHLAFAVHSFQLENSAYKRRDTVWLKGAKSSNFPKIPWNRRFRSQNRKTTQN